MKLKASRAMCCLKKTGSARNGVKVTDYCRKRSLVFKFGKFGVMERGRRGRDKRNKKKKGKEGKEMDEKEMKIWL